MAGRTVQQIYQKKSPIQHVLIRPDTYVGSIEFEKSYKWVLKKDQPMLEYREISFVPALFKIFDEVLVNATDNYQRDRKMNQLRVSINAKEGWISVHNNGKGIPIAIHKEHKIYVPELIFGHLLTGSNYDDTEKKVVGGRNGYGAKLANIFSTKFIVECGDGAAKKKFKMVWRDNMMNHAEAQVAPYTGKDFVTITFFPEFSRFQMTHFDEDTVALLSKRVYDMAGLLSRVKVFLNDEDISMSSFKKYVGMYFGPDSQLPIIYDPEVTTDRWEVVVSISEGQFRQVSFVNGICTTKGGKHVDYISNQIVEKIQEKIKKKSKDMTVKPFQVKAHLWIFVNCLIVNPTFDSQTKETMTLKISDFGSQCQLSDKMIKEVLKSGVVDQIYDQAKLRDQRKFANQVAGKKTNRVTGIPKLQDANNAGTRNSEKCTLILTQGDSAKGLAMSGLEVIGRDNYGVFPLKGKLLNVREAPSKILLKNEEIQSMMKIVGLNPQKQYEDVKSLRYGSIMIMADQDTDGSHIKGLVINFIHHFWPSLFKMQGFLKQFITPLLKSIKGKESNSFYTMKDFKSWADNIENMKSWKIKYYKGLGTSTDKQGQQYFQKLERHKIDFEYVDREDDEAMLLIFSKKKIQQRKEWLGTYSPDISMVYDRPQIRYKEFVDREFIHFSNEDNYRSIGSSVDGFKPGQRKIIFACFKRNLREEIKVAQLTGNVSENSAYHHGEMSLTETIVKMAQSFVGTNNINLLLPLGQFGSRNQGGKDHASARYIFTNLNKLTRLIFPEPDDHSLTYVQDDGQMVEPENYMPIIPMYLVNGCQGIGTGWSTFVPTFNPHEMTEMLIDRLSNGTDFPQIHPWVKGYLGTITKKGDDNYEMKGIIDVDYENKLFNIREITVGKWTKNYKKFLEEMLEEGETVITNFKEYHTNNRIHFQLEVNETFFNKYHDNIEYLEKHFKLIGNIAMTNLTGFDREHRIKRYPTAMHIFNDFYEIRLEYYHKRKAYMVSQLVRDLQVMSMKERFIMEIIQDQLVIKNIKKIVICETLKKRGFTPMKSFPKVKSTKPTSKSQKDKDKDQGEDESESEEEETANVSAKDYDYLLSLPIYSLTYEKVEEIKRQKKVKEAELESLEQTKVETLWINDLQEFKRALEKHEQKEEEERINGQSKRKGKAGNNKRVKGGGGKKGKQPEKAKGKKKEKEAICWDSSDDAKDSAKTENKQKSKEKNKPQNEKAKSKPRAKPKQKSNEKVKKNTQLDIQPKPQSGARSSFMERVKQKLKSKQQKSAIDGYVMKPYSKTNLDSDKEEEQVRIVRVPATRPKIQKSKKKMALESDDESEEQEEQEEEWQKSD